MNERIKRISGWILVALLLMVAIPFFFFILVYKGAFGKLYTGEELKKIRNYQGSEVRAADGRLLGAFYWQNRSNIDQQHIPPFLFEALIATEDARFYEHQGVDYRSMLRVFFKSLLMGEKSSGGGSTISQQLAKNLFRRERHGILTMPVNKVKEAIHALRFNSVYSQDEILMLYLNTVSVGEDTYGIKNAALRFFNKSPDSLTVSEAAVLIGMLKSPTFYNPRLHPENAIFRRNIVLNNMAIRHYIPTYEADSLKRLPIRLHYKNIGQYGEVAPYFMRQIEERSKILLDPLKNEEGKKYNLYTDGLKIYTTLDYQMQEFANSAIQTHMEQLQNLFDKQWSAARNRSVLTQTLNNFQRYQQLKKKGLSEAEIKDIFNEKHAMEVFDWKGGKSVNFSVLDSLNYCLKLLNTGFLAIEPQTGYIKVWIGGNNYHYFQYEHISAQRQVGSTFKPIVYATALEHGMSPCDYIENEKHVYSQFENWSPDNADGIYGGKYSLKGALANSVNVVSVEVLMKAGIYNVIQTAHKMGIHSDLPKVPSIALGVANISLLEMVKAYCVFPNEGKTVEPVWIQRIEDAKGKVIYKAPQSKSTTALSKQTSFYMTEMLKAVVNEGTAQKLRTKYHLTGEMAGKTGTTQSNADAWFIGYTPGLVAGVWVGAESPAVHFSSTVYGQGAYSALPIWGLFMQKNQMNKKYRHYAVGKFRPGASLAPMPECESYKKDNVFDKIKNLFRKKDKSIVKKKKGFLFWRK